MGKIKVKFPTLPANSGQEIESAWARLVSPMAGNDRGMFFLPEINDEVLVAFEMETSANLISWEPYGMAKMLLP